MCTVTRQFRVILLAVIVAIASVACTTPGVKQARVSEPEPYSGFLQDYSLLKADPSDPGYLRYVASGIDFTHYRKFILETPQVIINTGGQYQALDPVKIRELTDYYRASMTTELSKHFQVVTTPGPGVARLRVAVVGAVEVMPALKPRDLVPVSALFKVARMAVGENPYVLRVSIESEALDSQTGALLGETVDSRESTKTVTKGNGASLAQMHELIDFWVARFVGKLDKANGFTQ